MSKTRMLIATGATAVGLTLGGAVVANAATAGSHNTKPTTTAVEKSASEKADTDSAVDGVDHQAEGDEVGNNGDNVPGPDEAKEAPASPANG